MCTRNDSELTHPFLVVMSFKLPQVLESSLDTQRGIYNHFYILDCSGTEQRKFFRIKLCCSTEGPKVLT